MFPVPLFIKTVVDKARQIPSDDLALIGGLLFFFISIGSIPIILLYGPMLMGALK